MPKKTNEPIIQTMPPVTGHGDAHFIYPSPSAAEEHRKQQCRIIDENSFLRENYVKILAHYVFTDENGKKLEDYEIFREIIENEDSFTDALGHPLKNCVEYKQIKKIFCNASSVSLEPIHSMFGLSYSNYLVLRRSVLQSAPLDWQQRFCALMEDLENMFDDNCLEGRFMVQLRGDDGEFIDDEYADYERGRRVIPMKGESK